MIILAMFEFLEDYPIYLGEFYKKDNIIKMKFTMQYLTDRYENIAKSCLNSIDNGEIFSMDLFHDDFSGERYSGCYLKKVHFSIQVQDTVDVELIIDGNFEDLLDMREFDDPCKMKIVTSHDCKVDIISTTGVRVPETLYKAEFERKYNRNDVTGSISAYNRTLNQVDSPTFLEVTENDPYFSIRLCFKINDYYEDLFVIRKANLKLTHREIKNGIDKAEVSFETSDYV